MRSPVRGASQTLRLYPRSALRCEFCLSQMAAHDTSATTGQVYVRPFDGEGEPVQVSHDGGLQLFWSRDGRSLLFSVAKPNRDIWMLEPPEMPW